MAPLNDTIYLTRQGDSANGHESLSYNIPDTASIKDNRAVISEVDSTSTTELPPSPAYTQVEENMRDSVTTDSFVKAEDDDDTSSRASILRSLKNGIGDRDSPNSSTTSMSLMTPVNGLKSTSSSTSPAKPSATISNRSLYSRSGSFVRFNAKSSIPARLPPAEYGRQCVAAAEASRLNPYALHPDEHRLLKDSLCHLHTTVYINIRNGILRLWIRNPNVSVSIEEAIGCAKDDRWTQLACFAYEWLVRKGYINFGCVDTSLAMPINKSKRQAAEGPTIVVIGAGMAGLSCGRQLTNIYQHYPSNATPKVIILEGRSRIGGRIYSHPLSALKSRILERHQRPTAEMGAHIIVGFEHGNPLDSIIRGQLALNYHSLRDLSTLYDVDGSAVNEAQDTMCERLYNDVLDRTGDYRWKNKIRKTAEAEKELVDAGRDPPFHDDGITINQFEEAAAMGTIDRLLPTKSRRKGAFHKAPKQDKPTEGASTSTDSQIHLPAAKAAVKIGFALQENVKPDASLELDGLAADPNQTLGRVMDEGISQYHKMLNFRSKAYRLINWHYANLEYANATNVEKLSLAGWDQDTGNEFEGEHAQVVGGYQQLPRGLWRYPKKLDVRTNKVVAKIQYGTSTSEHGKARITCEDGEVFEADKVVLSAPLGVLKRQSIAFDPPLPEWKQGAISRLGFGLLNKLILVFDEPFWDIERDMFGLLHGCSPGTDGSRQEHYRAGRGKFYLFWNCIETSGLPVLIALMAGDAAHEAERASDRDLIEECMGHLRRVFKDNKVPDPLEAIVTRWKSDPFAGGSYSFVAAGSEPQDYDLMAKPIDNLFFAGEATCGTHPATVHGAYISGLRAAAEVVDSLIGPVEVADPIVSSTTMSQGLRRQTTEEIAVLPQKRKGDEVLPTGTFTRPAKETPSGAQQAYDTALWDYIYSIIGFAPAKPAKSGINPFLLYQKDHWAEVKEQCDKQKQATSKSKNPETAKATRDEIRIALGAMWRDASDDAKRPYVDETKRNKEENEKAIKDWEDLAREWDRRTWEVKDEWEKNVGGFEGWKAEWERNGKKIKSMLF